MTSSATVRPSILRPVRSRTETTMAIGATAEPSRRKTQKKKRQSRGRSKTSKQISGLFLHSTVKKCSLFRFHPTPPFQRRSIDATCHPRPWSRCRRFLGLSLLHYEDEKSRR